MNHSNSLTDRVDESRWKKAQEWEQRHWVREQKALARFGKNYIWRILSLFNAVDKYRGDDRNKWWSTMFGEYNFLPKHVTNALEVGCGPYTNIRLIRERCEPKHLYLSDPLIRTYAHFRMTFVNEMYRKVACCLDDHPLEELPFASDYFDLVVMINVLDHVRDATACMKNIRRVVRSGGFVIIGQDLTNADDLKKHTEGLQTGHPITLDAQWFEQHFSDFTPVVLKVLPREAGWAPDWHYGTLLFAGKLK